MNKNYTCCRPAKRFRSIFSAWYVLSKRILLVGIPLLFLAASYSPALAGTCTTGSTTGCNLGTETSPGSAATCTCSPTWATAGLCGSGATFTLTVAAHTYYDFNVSASAQNAPTTNLYGSLFGTPCTTSPQSGWGSGTNTSIVLGTDRTTAIACGSWGTTSATIQYRYSAPTVALASGTGYNAVASVCVGATSGYTITTTNIDGSNSAAYSWSVTSGTATITNATTATPTVTFTTAGSVVIKCLVTNGTCTASASTSTITVAAAPGLTAPSPSSQTDCNGATPTNITTTASGGTGTISYQWYSNASNSTSGGTSLGSGSGAQTTTYTPPTSANGTTYYYCIMTASGTNCTSATTPSTGAVIVDAQTSISAQPASSQTVCTGGAVTLSTTVTGGTGSWSYQWYYNNTTNSNSGGNAISGATSSTYTLVTSNGSTSSPGGTGVTGTYYYYCIITPTGFTNGCNTLTTNTAGVTVVAQPTITTQPTASQSVCTGGSVSLSATASGTGNYTYQWYYNNTTNSTSGGTAISGATGTIAAGSSTSYTLVTSNGSSASPGGTGVIGTYYYYCTFSPLGGTACGPVSTNTAGVTVVAQPTVTTEPISSQSVCTGGAVTLSAIPGGTGNYTYQWYYNNITNSTSGGTAISGSGTGTVAAGSSASYTLSTSNGSSASPGGTGVTGTYYYYCTFSPQSGTACGPVTTTTAGVTIVAQPTITTQPVSSQTVCTGGAASLSAVAGGTGSYTYQWYYNNTTNSSSGGTAISGATGTIAAGSSTTYTLVTSNGSSASPGGTGVTGTYYYYCKFSPLGGTACGPVSTSTGGVSILAQPTISTEPTSSQTVCTGATVTLTSGAVSGTGSYTYQWYYNGTTNSNTGGTSISGATGTIANGSATTSYTLATTNGSTSSPGGTGVAGGPFYYYCTFTPTSTDNCGPVTSTVAAVTVNAQPMVSSEPTSSQTTCTGATVTLTSGAVSGAGNYTYQWYYNNTTNSTSGGTAISGATGTIASGSATASYTLATSNGSSASPGGTGVTGTYYYYCTFSPLSGSNCGPVSSTSAGVTIVAQPTITTQPTASQSVCTGGSASLSAVASGTGNYTYQWYYNSTTNSTSGGTSDPAGTGTVAAGASTTYALATGNSSTASPGGTGVAGGPFYYYCVFTPLSGTNCGPVTTNAAAVTVDAQPIITTQPSASQSVCAGSPASLSAVASGTGSYTYQWYYNGTTNSNSGGTADPAGTGTVAAGATTAYNLSTTNGSTASPGGTGVAGGPYYYYCTFTPLGGTNCGPVTTNTGGVTVNPIPTPTFLTVPSNPICTYVNATYTTQSGQTNYSWGGFGTAGVDYNIISGGLGSTSSSVTVQWISTGTKTVTVAYLSLGCPASGPASNTTVVDASPTPTISTSGTNCVLTSFTYTTQSGQSNYTWTIPGTSGTTYNVISGGGTTNDNLVIEWLLPGTYTVSVNYTNSNGCTAPTVASNTQTFGTAPTGASISSVIDPCNGGWASEVNITGGTAPYTFYLSCSGWYTGNSPAEIDGVGASNCTLGSITDANGCACGTVTGNPASFGARALTTGSTESCTIGANSTQNFFDGSAYLMATVTSGSTALGNTSVAVSIDGSVQQFGPTDPQSYLQRHFVITPATSAAANVCLYISDAEVSNLNVASASDDHAAPAYYQTFATDLSNANITQYDGASETPSSHTSRQVITSITATHNPTVDGATYSGVWSLCFNVGGFSGFYINANNVNNDPLPVTLETFTANAINNHYIELNWATATEIGNAGFDIERSTDGVKFEDMGWAQGHGNSTVINKYQYTDMTALPGIVYYYRLKQVNVDGGYNYSGIVSATLIGSIGFTLDNLVPNPANSQVSVGVISNLTTSATITMTDMLGRVVLQEEWPLSVGYNTNEFDVSKMSEGAYQVTIYSGTVKSTKRLVITR